MLFWRKVQAASVLLAIAGMILPVASVQAVQKNFYIPDAAITIDGDLSEWGDPLIQDGEDNPDRERYCWNTEVVDWELMPDATSCETLIYDELGQIDIGEAWFGVNEKNMLLAFTTATPMFSFVDASTGDSVSFFNQATLAELGIDHFPNDGTFSHDMVFSFDADPVTGEETFDWYLVANLDADLSSPMGEDGDQEGEEEGEEGDGEFEGADAENGENFLQVWQEEGSTEGFQEDEDALIDSIDPSLSEVSSEDTEVAASKIMEIRQNVEKFYEITGIEAGDEVGFRLETKSTTGDETKTVTVVFQDEAVEGIPSKPLKLKAKEIKTTTASLNWEKPKTGGKITKYRVDFRPANDENRDNWTQYKTVKTTSQVVKKLKAKKKYEFRVSACNASGCGDWTKWAKLQTKKK